MPYVFAITVLLNIAALGYFVFVHKGLTGESPQVAQAKSEITDPVTMTKPNN